MRVIRMGAWEGKHADRAGVIIRCRPYILPVAYVKEWKEGQIVTLVSFTARVLVRCLNLADLR